ncbi:hypothetical protein [Streptomyces shenzhenensis]|uniref:hypothetical protein n=1 Tax=Streptomyces shenzhenensis TaxID=943815 RepID=UPI001F207166|nr:hypothetical protein [Streptomyces shenzhenensis]
MTRHTTQKPALRVAKTGWARARHLPRDRICTWVAAVERDSTSAAPPTGGDGNIVRGDD